MERISALGLDIGKKRVGVAVCDGTGLIATGLTTIERSTFALDIPQFEKIVKERAATILVAGLPYTMAGEVGTQAKQVQRYATRLSIALGLPLEYVDERCTSLEAEEILKERKKFSTRDKGAIDRQAATIILQQWLDTRRSGR
ncbi:Holliday junction resolvase RuvX [Pannus brasiliensis CCIBt3594]|uniref:Putative pre-16S rRNA nuclease n=1 Tax=Pannus brasiliensis CCIBt3594 TaxID=1427578 RepID=A0AAW9QPI5_9CHRO